MRESPKNEEVIKKLIALMRVPEERPWLTIRFLREGVAQRSIQFIRVGRRIWFDPAVLDAIPQVVDPLS